MLGTLAASAILAIAACRTDLDDLAILDLGGRDASEDALDAPSYDLGPGMPTELRASDYDQLCTTNPDCIAIQEGPCGTCLCANAAINQAESLRYYATRGRLGCGNSRHANCGCPDMIGICKSGRCAPSERWPTLDAGGFSRACTTMDDCTDVTDDPCLCTNVIAIAKVERERYEAARVALGCGTPVSPCEGLYGVGLTCDAGTCTTYQLPRTR